MPRGDTVRDAELRAPLRQRAQGAHLSDLATGVRFKLAAYVEAGVPTPHSFRHATAVHLVSAGVDITIIRCWLGHVSLDTTNHYAQANLETKRKALERVGAPGSAGKPPSWKRDASVLAWLDTL